MKAETRTKFYLRYAKYINCVLRKFNLLLWAEFEGDPPERPYLVQRVWIARLGVMRSR